MAIAPYDDHKNFAISTVATAPSPATSGLSFSVGTGHGARFPAAPFDITVFPAGTLPDPTNAEVIRVISKSGDTFTSVARAQQSSTARSIQIGDIVFAGWTVGMVEAIEAGKAERAAFTAFTSSGTYTMPANVQSLEIFVIGGGGGGGSGRRGATGSLRGGGGGGGSGQFVQKTIFNASPLGNLTVTVGAAGTGGAAVTSDNTNGNIGVVGGSTIVAAGSNIIALAFGGDRGANGSSVGGGAGGTLSGGVPFSASQSAGGTGGNGTTLPTQPFASDNGAGAGGAGGGLSGSNVDQFGSHGSGAGGMGATPGGTSAGSGGAGGGSESDGKHPVAGAVGQSAGTLNTNRPGGGGGGGGSGQSGPGAGGSGSRGGGGGGGGASQNGAASGAGGAGGAGAVLFIAHF